MLTRKSGLSCIFTSQTFYLNFSLFITKRLIGARKKAFSAFIMRISILATTISVAVMIISLSFINGFQQVIADKIFGFWGHIRIQHFEPVRSTIAEETPIIRDLQTEKSVTKNQNVSSISAYATKSAILNIHGTIEGVLMKGVNGKYPFKNIDRFLTKGHWPTFKDSTWTDEIVLSEFTANQLGASIGQSVIIYFIQEDGSAPKTRKLKIVGLFKTGIDVYDRVYAIGDMKLIQKLNGWNEDQIGGYEVSLKEPSSMEFDANEIYAGLPDGLNALTLKDLSPEIFDWLNLQDTNKYIMIVVMTVVALINLITCLIILLLERTSMIAILKALGSGNFQIQKIFITYGIWISGIGVGLGTFLGLGLCYFQQYTKFIKLNEEAYYVDHAPVVIHYMDIVMIVVGTIAVSALILFIPSFISRKISPAKALRFK